VRIRDIYDDIPDGAAQRSYNQRRLVELEQEGDTRRARISTVVAQAELSRRIVAPISDYTL
jgi:hypothetical protein